MSDSIPFNNVLNDSSGDTILVGKDQPVRLKLSFLLPLALVFLALIITFTFLTFNRTQQQISNLTRQTISGITSMFNQNILENSSMLEAVSRAVLRNKEIEAAFIAKDRSHLLSLSTSLFDELSRDHRITHFYYHSTDRTNLLRVHKPQRFGDKINRFTMLEAESIRSTSSGIELGILGTFTLRHVTPWYDSNQKLIGYIELGMEIDSILDSIEQFYCTTLYMLIAKKYLNKDQWIEGMEMIGHKNDWDLLHQFAVTNLREGKLLPDGFIRQYANPETVAQGGFKLTYNNRNHRVISIPIDDKGKRNVGSMWVIIDTEHEISKSNRLILLSTAVATTLGTVLLVLFYRLVSSIESELKKHQRTLRQIATHDGLTGIYNRRSFDTIIVSEFERAERYNRDLSLLIIDIDHFKLVNDKYGHIAGDSVLKELAAKLSGRLRSNDHLARYGGEEFVIILPETPLDMAHLFAERVRTSVGEKDFEVGNNLTAPVTISIGISSFPAQSKTVKELVHFADNALYEAKETGRNRVCDFKPDSEVSS